MTTRIVAITGNIGSGKSAVAALLESHGAVRIDADQVAREVVRPGTPALAAILQRFGASILTPEGELDRAALGRLVFASPEARRDLEAITHPAIRERMAERISAAIDKGARLVAVEIPLLFESGLDAAFPLSLLVTAPDPIRKARIIARDRLSDAEAEARMAAQMPQDAKRSRATWILENDGGYDELRAAVTRLWPILAGA